MVECIAGLEIFHGVFSARAIEGTAHAGERVTADDFLVAARAASRIGVAVIGRRDAQRSRARAAKALLKTRVGQLRNTPFSRFSARSAVSSFDFPLLSAKSPRLRASASRATRHAEAR